MLQGGSTGASGAHEGAAVSSSYGSNPVSALIAGRATSLAPPSLSTVQHSDSLPTSSQLDHHLAINPKRALSLNPRFDFHLQQALSPATAATPVYTRENISISGPCSRDHANHVVYCPSTSSTTQSVDFTVHPSFREDADHRGDVLVRVEQVDFFVHRHVLQFSSPFFASVLDGEWKESCLPRTPSTTSCAEVSLVALPASDAGICHDKHACSPEVDRTRPASGSSCSARSQASLEEEKVGSTDDGPRHASLPSQNIEKPPTRCTPDTARCASITSDAKCDRSIEASTKLDSVLDKTAAMNVSAPSTRLAVLATPPGSPTSSTVPAEHREALRQETVAASSYKDVIAVIDLKEETATTFQDFLCHIYPHLDLSVTWWNCGSLLRFADKFQVPYLRRSCVVFLRAALAGRPIQAMQLAEMHSMDDVYREASRHVLDNFAAWEAEELNCLSPSTLLKLERKRTWFLERLLKLGLASPARDYECQPSCPDAQACARVLQEKWQSAYANAFRFSPPQPSVIFRHLRELEPTVHAFLPSSACQNSARIWVQGLFDRMFSLSTLHAPRQFLSIKLADPPHPHIR